jgi:hypothetical protein
MNTERTYGVTAARTPGEPPLRELRLDFVPLDFVAEWRRCSETADYFARFFAFDYEPRITAASVLSTVLNELIENAVKFSTDKTVRAELVVAQYGDTLNVRTINAVAPALATAFGDTIVRVVAGEPEAMFVERVTHPPETGGAGIGLIMLRKDYDARIGARIGPHASRPGLFQVEVEVNLDNRHIEQR